MEQLNLKMNNVTPQDIRKMSYVDFVSFIKEENRPPGGKKTVRVFLKNSFMNHKSKILEVGCTNGFTSLEIARLINCRVWGVDIHPQSINNAMARIQKEKIKFKVADAENLPFNSNYFDMVVTSNATSFMKDKNKATKEYYRVIKPWGFVSTCPMYYSKRPPKKIVNKVSRILGFKLEERSKEDWILIFKKSCFEIYFSEDYYFDFKTKSDINYLVQETLQKPHLLNLSKSTKEEIRKRWFETLSVFNDNLSYMKYSIILLRKRGEVEERELFTTAKEN